MVRENQIVIAPAQDVYTCIPCFDRQFNSEHSLLQHCRYSGAHSDEWCERCRWLFVHPQAYQNHVQASGRHWTCDTCDFDGMDRANLLGHMADAHSVCLDCNEYFFSSDFEEHRIEDHNRCANCSQEFATQNELLMHEQVHMDRDVKCYGCDKMFKSPSGVLIHLESRTCPSGTTPAQIDEWAFTFELSVSEDYTNNRYSRNKYRCSVCNSNFPKLSALFQHVESPACSADFSYYSNMEDLRAHIEEEVEELVNISMDDSRDDSMDDSSDGYPW